MKLIILSIFCISINFIYSFELEATLCFGENLTHSEPVADFCKDHGIMLYRCCRSLEDNTTFIAINLIDANLTGFPNFAQYSNWNLSVIDLRLNPDLTALNDSDFLGFLVLDELILPEDLSCPGGERAWEQIDNVTNPSGIRCLHPKDICVNSKDVCVASGSMCVANGLFQFLCKCKPNYHGYKCLRHGQFPSGAFYGSTIGLTIVVSIFLYWTQRRHVVKKTD